MTRQCTIIFAALSFASLATARAQDVRDSRGSGDAQLVKPFVGETTFLIVKIDAARISLPDVEKASYSPPAEVKAAYEQASKALGASLAQLQMLADGEPLFATVGIPISEAHRPLFFFRRKTSDKNIENVTAFVKNTFKGKVHVDDNTIVATPPEGAAKVMRPASDAAHEQIAAAFKTVAGYPIQLVVRPPDYVWRTVSELSPELPRQLGGGPSDVLTDGAQWAGIGFDPERLRLEIIIQSTSDEAARALAAYLPKLLRSMYKAAKPIHSKIPAEVVNLLFGSLKPRVEKSQVKIRIDGFEKTSANLALLAGVAQIIGEARRQNSHQQRFHQILLAMHNYHDTHQMLPPADRHRKDGKHGLSWRVHILPYVEQQALYNQFHLDEPWDSSHNKKLIEQMPDIYARNATNPLEDEVKIKLGYTTFLAPVGEQTIFGGAQSTTFRQITDGLSNTVALLEVKPEKAVPWTAPKDYSFDPQNPLEGVLIGSDGKWLAGFADGSVRYLPGDISRKTALFLFQMNDGNPIDFEKSQ